MISLEKAINFQLKYLLIGMGKCDKKFYKEFLPAIIKVKTSIMSKITLDSKKRKKKVCERNSYFLAKESFKGFNEKVEKRCFGLVGKIKDNDYICIDEMDIAKPGAKLMEGIHKIMDSSIKKVVNGFIFHCVSIKGIPVIMEQEDLVNKTKSEYIGIIFKKLLKYTKGKGTIVLDALYDCKSYMNFFLEKKCNFIVRAKRNRNLYNKNGEKTGKMKEFKEGIHEVFLKLDSKNKDNNNLIKIFLYVKQFEGYNQPLRIYSNTNDRNILEYKQRWDIEVIFKSMKQEFEMEKIQAGSLQVLSNIVATIQMAVAFTNSIYGIQNSYKGTTFFQCNKVLTNRFKKYAHWQGYTMNRNSFIGFISYTIKGMYKYSKKNSQKKININPPDPAQQKLFIMNFL